MPTSSSSPNGGYNGDYNDERFDRYFEITKKYERFFLVMKNLNIDQ